MGHFEQQQFAQNCPNPANYWDMWNNRLARQIHGLVQMINIELLWSLHSLQRHRVNAS